MGFPAASYVFDMVTKTPHGRRRNRFYYGSATVVIHSSQIEALATGVFDHFCNKMNALMGLGVLVEKCEGYYYGVGGAGYEGVSTHDAVPGTITSDEEGGSTTPEQWLMPDEASLILKVLTGKTGRSKRGRRFITGLSEAVNDNGEIQTLYRPEAIALATAVPEQISVTHVSFGPEPVFLDARHYDRKNNVMEPIEKCYALSMVGTRLDRRKPLRPEVLVTVAGGG